MLLCFAFSFFSNQKGERKSFRSYKISNFRFLAPLSPQPSQSAMFVSVCTTIKLGSIFTRAGEKKDLFFSRMMLTWWLATTRSAFYLFPSQNPSINAFGSETSIDRFWGPNIVKGSVGWLRQARHWSNKGRQANMILLFARNGARKNFFFVHILCPSYTTNQKSSIRTHVHATITFLAE